MLFSEENICAISTKTYLKSNVFSTRLILTRRIFGAKMELPRGVSNIATGAVLPRRMQAFASQIISLKRLASADGKMRKEIRLEAKNQIPI